MSRQVILAVDQGTTNTKILLVDRSGSVIHRVSEPVQLIPQQDARVEQDPEELWRSVKSAAQAAARYAREFGAKVEAIAIANQRETALAWSAGTGAALGNAVSWQCMRSAKICERLRAKAELIRGLTGLPLAPLISAGLVPSNGILPVAISYSTVPKENRSVRASSAFARTCSGDI